MVAVGTTMLIRTFDVSQFAGDLLIRRPQLLEETTRDEISMSRSRWKGIYVAWAH